MCYTVDVYDTLHQKQISRVSLTTLISRILGLINRSWTTNYWVVVSNIFFLSPWKLGKMKPIWRAYCSDGLVQPPTRLPFDYFSGDVSRPPRIVVKTGNPKNHGQNGGLGASKLHTSADGQKKRWIGWEWGCLLLLLLLLLFDDHDDDDDDDDDDD